MSIYPVSMAASSANDSITSGSTANSSATNYTSMFMRLLSTELQSQYPTQTMDPTTMVTQMVQINQLSDVAGIYSILQGASGSATSGAGSTSGTGAAGGTTNGTNANPIGSSPTYTPFVKGGN